MMAFSSQSNLQMSSPWGPCSYVYQVLFVSGGRASPQSSWTSGDCVKSMGECHGSACSSHWDESVPVSWRADQPHTTRNCKESETRKVDLCWLFWFAVRSSHKNSKPNQSSSRKSGRNCVFFLNHCQESTHVLSGHKHRCDYSEEAANTQRHEPDLLQRSRTAPGMILSRTPAKTKWFGLVHGSWLVENWRCQDQICPTNY